MSWNIAKPGDQINGPVAVTGSLNVDSNTLFVDSANNRVGVLTASPTVPLDVVGDAKVSGNLTVDTNTLVVDAANNRLGIGTATPATALHVFGTGSQALSVERDGATIQSRLEIISGNSTNLIRATVAKDLLVEQGTGTEVLRIATNGVCTWSNVVNAGTAMTLNGTGLGVGGTPSAKLTVWGAAASGNSTIESSAIRANAGGTLSCFIGHDSAANRPFIQASTGNAGTADWALLLQPYGGNVGIGTSTANFRADIQNASGAAVLRLKGGTGAAQGSAVYLTYAGSANTLLGIGDRATILGGTPDQLACIYSGVPLTFEINGSERLRIDASGNLGLGTATPSTGTLNKQITINSGAAALAGIMLQNTATGTSFNDGTGLYINNSDFFINNFEAGSVSINTSATSRLTIKSTGQVNFVGLSSDPAGAAAGDVYYNTTTNKLKCYNGTTWNDLF